MLCVLVVGGGVKERGREGEKEGGEGRRERGRDGERKGGKEEGRKGGKERGRKRGREEGREGERKATYVVQHRRSLATFGSTCCLFWSWVNPLHS